ncbi:hypothetical protein NDI52_31195 [Leptolyngbya sp. PL-A3]|uniref:hypothetical protein n=1 Tax=Leptolyngbya sp. PL-A3 TaxID=2933911 RepID=UPI00329802EA
MRHTNVSDVYHSLSNLVEQLADFTDPLEDLATGQTLEIERVNIDLPIELNISVNDEGNVTLRSSPPTQTTETTILPVFHRLSLQIIATDGQ